MDQDNKKPFIRRREVIIEKKDQESDGVLSYSGKTQDIPKDVKWQDPFFESVDWDVPIGNYEKGSFGSKRKTNYNTGVDIFCPPEIDVYALESGKIVKIIIKDTFKIIMVEGYSGVIAYGNVLPEEDLYEGMEIERGDIIGATIPYYVHTKTGEELIISKLHIEYYRHGTRFPEFWAFGCEKPKRLLDPTRNLLNIRLGQK